jgi:hypothetical protein
MDIHERYTGVMEVVGAGDIMSVKKLIIFYFET